MNSNLDVISSACAYQQQSGPIRPILDFGRRTKRPGGSNQRKPRNDLHGNAQEGAGTRCHAPREVGDPRGKANARQNLEIIDPTKCEPTADR